MESLLNKNPKTVLEQYFSKFRANIIGVDHQFESVYGRQNLLYADWIASGRLYAPIEAVIQHKVGSMIANTHSFSSETGKTTTYAYQHARDLIKKHVNANNQDVLVTTGTGMTAALSKLQRIMGLRSGDKLAGISQNKEEKPVVFITHMEHHSNQVPWYETIADIVILPADENNLVAPKILSNALVKYANRKVKIGSFTACSNVTGIITPYYELAKIMHQQKGFCFVDFAASAPYVKIDMHPEDPEQQLDAIFFSPHKFLGGPGSCGVLVFNEKLYHANAPDSPGGGNVKWTNPWGAYVYNEALEIKEDGGTPGFLQVIRTALCLELKAKMGVEHIQKRETELVQLCFDRLQKIEAVSVLGDTTVERIACISFMIENVHYNLVVRLLNDRFGIQVRGGWSCASTYAHYLLGIDEKESAIISKGIGNQDLRHKPGWVRLSLHPTMTNEEVLFICDAIEQVSYNYKDWQKDYRYNPINNEFENFLKKETIAEDVKEWFLLD